MRLWGVLHGEEIVLQDIDFPAAPPARSCPQNNQAVECQAGKKPLTSASLRYQLQPSLFSIQSSPTTLTFSVSTLLIVSLSVFPIQSWFNYNSLQLLRNSSLQ